MAAPSCQILLLICVSFFLFAGAAAGDGADDTQQNTQHEFEDSPNISYTEIDLAPTADAPFQDGGGASESPAAAGDGASESPAASAAQSLEVGPGFVSIPMVKDTPAVNMFVASAMVKSMSKTENFIDDVIETRLKDPTTDKKTKECLLTCKEAYEDSMSAMKKTVEDVKDGNLYKANVDVSAMSSNADTCKECMGQVYGKDDPQFKRFEAWIDGVSNDCLDKITGIKE